MKQRNHTICNILYALYCVGIFLMLILLNLFFNWLAEGIAHTYDYTLFFCLSPLVWALAGGYLWIHRFLRPSMMVKIVCKATLLILLFFGCTFTGLPYIPFITWVNRISVLPPLISGYLLFSLVSDIVILVCSRRHKG